MRKVGSYITLLGLAAFCCTCSRNEPDATPGVAATGPATQSAARAAPLRIAVIPKSVMREFWRAVHAGAARAELELEGVQIIWKGPLNENDRAHQINVVEDFINAGVSGIVLAPLDRTALVGIVAEARKAGIPSVIIDSDLNGTAGTDFVSFVATDNRAGGAKAGRHLGKLLDGKGSVLVMRHMVGSASTNAREEGCLDTFSKEFPEIRILSSDQYAGPTQESAMSKAESLLSRFPQVDGIFCPNDTSAFGMLRALQQAGRAGKVRFVGFDAIPQFIEAMKAGQMHGFVVQDPFNMGYQSVMTLVSHLRGSQVARRIDTGSEVVTPENMNEPRIRDLLAPPIDRYLK